jgi:phage baseplate assembly protein gpV
VIRYGVVQQTKKGYVKLLYQTAGGNALSPWVPVPQDSTVGTRKYRQLEKGTMVSSIVDDDGEVAIIGACYNDKDPAPGGDNDTAEVIEFSDGTVISYDPATQSLGLTLAGGVTMTVQGDCTINVAGACTLSADSGSIGLRCYYNNNPQHVFA